MDVAAVVAFELGILGLEEEVFEGPGGLFVKIRRRVFFEEYLIVFERGPI